MRLPLLLLATFFYATSNAQFLQDVNGKPYLTTSYEQYEGSPLLFTSWVNAQVVTASGRVYDSMLINIDLYQDMPLFIRNGQTFTFTDKITEFTLTDGQTKMVFKKGHLLGANLPDVFMEVLSASPLFARNSTRKLVDVPSYGTVTRQYRFAEANLFYATVNGSVQKISLSKSDAEKVFGSKWKEVSAYASRNDLSFKSESSWRSLLAYYNTL
jgi:hypothetical protein